MSEQRAYKTKCEVREGPSGPMIVGYAAVYNRDSEDLGGFIEQVDPGAFTKTLAEADVRGLVNHDTDWLIGRSKSGTLRMMSDPIGLRYEIDVNTADPDGMRALAKVKRGDLDGSSFSFITVRDSWDWQSTPAQRRLLECALIDVGPVVYPAYPDSTAASRALAKIATKVGHPVEELVMALQSGEIRSLVTPEPPAPAEQETENQTDQRAASTEIGMDLRFAMKRMCAALNSRENRDMPSGPGDPENMNAMVGAVMVAYNAKLAELGMEQDDDGFMLMPMADQDGDADGDGPTLFCISDSTACWYIMADGGSASVIAFDAYDMDDMYGYYRSRSDKSDDPRTWAVAEAELRMRERRVADVLSR